MTTTMSITSGQVKQIVRFTEDAARKAAEEALAIAGLDKDGAQRVIERGGDFQGAIQAATLAALKQFSINEQYASEEMPSSYGYPKKYAVRSLAVQIDEIRKHFSELSLSKTNEFIEKVLPTLALPAGAEGWFAIPRWERIASTYNEAVLRMLAALKSTRKFKNYCEGQLGPDRLRQHERTVRTMMELAESQPGDILIIPAQFGKRHAGRSVRRARAVLGPSEFGLGAFASGCMLIAHPERITRYEDLCVDCAGDEYDYPDGSRRWFVAPLFGFDDGGLEFVADWVSSVGDYCGSASGFLPQ